MTDLYGHRSLRPHPLRGDWPGQLAMRLTGDHRLIIEPVRERAVRILGVEDYHGD